MSVEDLKPVFPPEEDEGGPVKTFLEHLEDLRWVLIKIFASLVLGMVICLGAAPDIAKFLAKPLVESNTNISPEVLGPMGGFNIAMKIGLYGGLCLALPFLLFFIGQFILPALKANEKSYFLRAFGIGGGLFVAGVSLCYFVVLKISIIGLVQFNKWMGFDSQLWRAEEYYQFAIVFMIGMGISLEIPVVILTLVRVGLIPHEMLIKGRAYFIIGNLVVCAFISPDAISTLFMVLPVQALMEICILISKHWERQKRIAEARELASARLDAPPSQ
ncbi:MAG: twin-arginine translocase subunit TatC [Verrucomicrobiales bacterium]